MRSESKILVVGTTPDYIDIIRGFAPGKALFITEPELRRKAEEPCPDDREEILADFSTPEIVFSALRRHLEKYKLTISGVSAFDCESLPAASFIAERLKRPFPTPRAVANSRDKFTSKKLWKAEDIRTPETGIVDSPEEAVSFFRQVNGKSVIKPKTGAGSELVFLCSSRKELEDSYNLIEKELKTRKDSRLYDMESRGQVIMEEFIDATEYSADFAVSGDSVRILRLTRKIKSPAAFFGITIAYLLLDAPPEGTSISQLRSTFLKSCNALGIDNAICMMDFFVRDGEIFLLETAPRPGGDCIPFLLEKAGGPNIIETALDFSVRQQCPEENLSRIQPYLGIRIIADRPGIFEEADTSMLGKMKSIKTVRINRKPGSEILMPPDDYDSWILGYVIAEQEKSLTPEQQVTDILGKVYCKITEK